VRSSLERKLVVGLLVLLVVPVAAALAVVVLLDRANAFAGNPTGVLVVALAVSAGLMLWLGVEGGRVLRGWVRRLHEIRLGAELIGTVNPAHRLDVHTGDELEALAQEVNRIADRLGEARAGLEAETARATRALEVERGKLAAVLETLGEGVAVIAPDGLVILANRAAHELLGATAGGLLGRTLFDFVDREKIAHFRDRLRGEVAERFSLPALGGLVLEAMMTPFFDADRRMIGVVLVLRDVTRPVRADEERRDRLARMLPELRGPLASVRSLSESLLADPGGVTPTARRLLEAIHIEALRLSAVVAEGASLVELAGVPGHFEEIAAPDLVAMAVRRLGREGDEGRTLEVDGDVAGAPAVMAEASALSGGLAHVLRVVLRRRRPGGRAWLRFRQRGGVLQLDAGAEGEAALADVEPALDAPVALGTAGRSSMRSVVRHHAGEVWAYAGEGRFGFRVTLPVAVPAVPPRDGRGEPAARPSLPGAGLVSGFAHEGGPVDERPDFYDFSLFEEMERSLLSADRGRALDELTCTVFDTETTGFHPEDGDRIVSLAGVRVRGGAVRRGEVFDALVNPGRPIPSASVRFHGITDDMVADAPPLDVVLPAFLRFADSAVLVGHQVWFDLRFLEAASRELGLPAIARGRAVLDTVALSEVVHGPLERHGLDAVAARLGVSVRGRHSALGDALATAEILARLLALLRKRGVRTLGEVLEAMRRARRFGVPRGAGS
jgi:DNA polymerase-3 subunit epsilon